MKRAIAVAAGFGIVLIGAANLIAWLGAQVYTNGRPSVMLADGIPARDIFTDHAGFATWDSDRRDYGKVMRRLEPREALARVKAVGDTVVGAGPKSLGAQIPITGDGRESWGPAGLAISLSEK